MLYVPMLIQSVRTEKERERARVQAHTAERLHEKKPEEGDISRTLAFFLHFPYAPYADFAHTNTRLNSQFLIQLVLVFIHRKKYGFFSVF